MNNKSVYRPIAIPLNEKFEYVHATHDENEQSKHLFVGRKRIIEKLLSLLNSENRKRGSYLITGYRGVGKTSVINKALNQYQNEQENENGEKPLVVRINLGDNSRLTPLNIYFTIVNILRNEICKEDQSFSKNPFRYSLKQLIIPSSKLTISQENCKEDQSSNKKSPFLRLLKRLFLRFSKPTISLQNIAVLTITFLTLVGFLEIGFLKIAEKSGPVTNLILDQMYRLNSSEPEFIWWLFILFFVPILLVAGIWKFSLSKHPKFGFLREIDELNERMSNEISEARSTGLNYHYSGIGWYKHKTKLPINAREAEDQLSRILDRLNKKGIKVIFVLDEIDKLSDHEELSEIHYNNTSNIEGDDKINRINTLLGSLKNFVTTAHATFFFISGRETLDRYYSEKGSPNSLYESLFDQVFEVPSLLTDEGEIPRGTQLTSLIEEYVCRRIKKGNCCENERKFTLSNTDYCKNEKKYTLQCLFQDEQSKTNEIKKGSLHTEEELEIRFYISFLRSFIHFLTFHSWGNPKRLNTIFESFIVPRDTLSNKFAKGEVRTLVEECWTKKEKDECPKYWLLFNNSDKYSFALTSEITTLFQHQLSREVTRISDKLTVSAFSSLHFILKLHSYGFSRETLHRMSETINIYRSPELNTIVDDLLTNVFKPYIRRIRNGMYRYRFHSGFEQELRYISHVFELESASYNFSLNSMKHVKRFFNDVLTNTNDEEIGVISRTHIILGDMSSIEQSYNAASEHYSIATRILRKVLKKKKSVASRVNLINYIEVLLKQGDLAEHRHNYGRAAALYSEAESIVKKHIDDFQLSDRLKKGDSKWDLLKQPFWANRYLSLKRSPRPFKGDLDEVRRPNRPVYLYRDNDPRFYNFAACLFFFMGDAKSAANAYNTTIRFTNQVANMFFDERTSFLRNYAIVGIVESTLIYRSRKLFECYLSDQATNNKKKLSVFLDSLLNLALKEEVLSLENPVDTKISKILKVSASDYENNRLYISTVITCIKTISYFTTILDSFDNCTFAEQPEKLDKLDKLVDRISELVAEMAKNAVRCIDKARQLESSQSIKTLMVYDFNGLIDEVEKDFTKLIDWLLSFHSKKEIIPIHENIFWQHSLWTPKLASALLWFDYVRKKLCKQETNYESEVKENYLPDLSFIAIRPAIQIRWTHARLMLNQHIEKKLVFNEDFEKCDVDDILSIINKEYEEKKRSNLSLTDAGSNLVDYLLREEEIDNSEAPPEIFKKVYEISRLLYFSVHQSRIISRKNIDLIFPRLSQIYHIQWKLLTNLIAAILVRINTKDSLNTTREFYSIRNISFALQRKLISLDKKLAPHDRIPPSYFDYEYIYLRLGESLESSANLVDRTSRSHMSIFQHKYFCHDDHNDQEFHMDYTLAYMFTPMALYFRDQIKETHENFKQVISETVA